MSAPAAAATAAVAVPSVHHPMKAGVDIDCASIPLKISCKGHQYAATENVKLLVAYRGSSIFYTTTREAAHMDQGLLVNPDDPSGATRLPWKEIKLADLILMKAEMPGENGETVLQYQAYWRRCTGEAAHDDRYGMRLVKLQGLKQILGNLGAIENGAFVVSTSAELTERRQYLFDGLNEADTKLWLEFIQLCEQKNFASGLSINFLDALKHFESTGGAMAPFKLRQQVEPDWVPARPRGEFDSAVTPIRRPKVSKSSAITTIPSDEALVHPPANVFPLLNGGSDNVSILHGLPKDAHKHVTDKMIIVTARTESLKALKRKRDEDGGDAAEMISKKELRSFHDRVNIKEVPGGLTVFSFSGSPGDLRIADDKDGVFFVFHGSSPPCLGGASVANDDAGSMFEVEDVDGDVLER